MESVDFSGILPVCVTGSVDNTARIWDTASSSLRLQLDHPQVPGPAPSYMMDTVSGCRTAANGADGDCTIALPSLHIRHGGGSLSSSMPDTAVPCYAACLPGCEQGHMQPRQPPLVYLMPRQYPPLLGHQDWYE